VFLLPLLTYQQGFFLGKMFHSAHFPLVFAHEKVRSGFEQSA
jgi:hypothetical protein